MDDQNILTNYHGSDFYCDVALQNVDKLHVEYEDDNIVAFRHTRPHWSPVHIVVTPKRHIPSFTNYAPEDEETIQQLLKVVRLVAKRIEDEYGAARIVTNLGDYQDSKHIHFHVAYGKYLM